jgi:hypothetical protein
MTKCNCFLLLLGFLFLKVPAAISQTKPTEETQFSFYGFGRTSFVWDNQDMGRSDLFVPANIKYGRTVLSK